MSRLKMISLRPLHIRVQSTHYIYLEAELFSLEITKYLLVLLFHNVELFRQYQRFPLQPIGVSVGSHKMGSSH